MGTGTLEVQIFVSLAVILGTALIALIVDYLKGNNENLREHNIELRVRQQERDRSTQLNAGRRRARVAVASTQQVPQAEAPTAAAVAAEANSIVVEQEAVAIPVAAAVEVPAFVEEVSRPGEAEAAVTPSVEQRMDAVAEVAAIPAEPVAEQVAEVTVEAVPEPVVEQVAEAIPEPVVEQVAEAIPEPVSRPEPSNVICIKPVGEPVEAPARFRSLEFNEFFEVRVKEPVVDAAEAPTQPEVESPVENSVPEPDVFVFHPVEEDLVETVVAPAPAAAEPEAPYELPAAANAVDTVLYTIPEEPVHESVAAVVETETAKQSEPGKPQLIALIEPSLHALEIPIGFQSSELFEALVATQGVLSGVVVAIGINDYQKLQSSHSKPAFDELLSSVTNLVQSIAGNKGLAVRRSEDEFILIFPQDSGSMGQRRLSQISERLWDFQLRSLGSFSILFSWGAVEVAAEQLDEAIDAALEQMHQTKRSRTAHSMESRKRAVNS